MVTEMRVVNRKRSWLAGWARVSALVALPVLGGCGDELDQELFVVDAAMIDVFSVVADDANVEIAGGTSDEIRIIATREYSTYAPSIEVETVERQVNVAYECPRQLECGVDFLVLLPRELAVSATADTGSILMTQMSGPIDIQGDWGNVLGFGLTSPDVAIETDEGEVSVSLEAPPETLRVVTEDGDIFASVPVNAGYRIDAVSEEGSAQLSGLEQVADADRSITLRSLEGDIVLRGVAPPEESLD